MTVVNTKSAAISNRDSQPRIITPAYLDGAPVRTKRAMVAVGASDSAASVYRFFQVRSSDLVQSLKLGNTAMSGLTSATVGLYRTAKDGGAAVSAALFATGIDIHTASALALDLTFAVTTVAQAEKRIWELLGLTADPFLDYDVCLVATNAPVQAGTIAMHCSVVNGGD